MERCGYILCLPLTVLNEVSGYKAMMKKQLSILWMMQGSSQSPPLARAGKNTYSNTPLMKVALKKRRNGFSIA